MTRSVIRIREVPHIDPTRRGETICEVLRDGEVVATVYGTYGGLQIVSGRIKTEKPPVYFEAFNGSPSYVMSLLADGEPCPSCSAGVRLPICPVCGREETTT